MLNEVVIANKNYAVQEVKNEENLDSIALNVIRQDCPPFMQIVRVMNIDGMIQLRYELTGGIRLAYVPMKMRKQELNRLLFQMLTPLKDCVDWFLDYHNICFDRNYIFVSQSDFNVQYIYLPECSFSRTEEEILEFFRDLIMEIELTDDPAYITRLLRYIMGKGATVLILADMIKENLSGNTAGNVSSSMETSKQAQTSESVQNQNVVQGRSEDVRTVEPEKKSVFAKIDLKKTEERKKEKITVSQVEQKMPELSEKSVYAEKEFGKSDLMNLVGQGLFGEVPVSEKDKKGKKEKKAHEKKEKGSDVFGRFLGKSKKKEEPESEKAVFHSYDTQPEMHREEVYHNPVYGKEPKQHFQVNDSYADRTEIAEDVEEVQDGVLTLCLDDTPVQTAPKRIVLPLERGYAVLGRFDKTGKASADFNFDMSFTYIGRRHLRLEKEGDQFYLIDLESKNHTYLNGEELLPNHRYPLKKGDRISITRKYNLTYRVC